jgi:hypothetical protein
MAAEMVKLPDGSEALIVTHSDGAHQLYPLDVIAAYSELLGEPDPVQTVLLIRQAMKPENPVNWGEIYRDLGTALGDLVEAGVATADLPDALSDPGKVGKDKAAAMRARQQSVRAKLGRPTGRDATTNEFAGLLQGKADAIKEHRARFLRNVAPEPQPRRAQQAKALFSSERE